MKDDFHPISDEKKMYVYVNKNLVFESSALNYSILILKFQGFSILCI